MTDKIFGLAVAVMDELPANAFMLVSRIEPGPAHPMIYHVLRSDGREIREWRGTLGEALEIVEGPAQPLR